MISENPKNNSDYDSLTLTVTLSHDHGSSHDYTK